MKLSQSFIYSRKNMNPSFTTLSSWNSYLWVGNTFSKFFLLQQTLKEKGSFLLIVEHDNSIKNYQEICKSFWVPFCILEKESDLESLLSKSNSIFCITLDNLDDYAINAQREILNFKKWETIQDIYQITQKLHDMWYDFNEYLSKGSYKRNWDVLSIRNHNGNSTAIITFWGDEIESIEEQFFSWEKLLQKTFPKTLSIGANTHLVHEWTKKIPLIEKIWENSVFSIFDTLEFHWLYKNSIFHLQNSCSLDILWNQELNIQNLSLDDLKINSLEEFKSIIESSSKEIYIYTKHRKLISEFISFNNIFHKIHITEIHNSVFTSFYEKNETSEKKNVYIICDDIINPIFTKKRVKKKLSENLDLLLKIKKWDLIVHIDHGVGIFFDIIKREIWDITKEYVELHYKDNDKLYVPITEVARISKYIGSGNPELTPLSGKVWERKMSKVQEDIQHIAEELLENFAERKLRQWNPYHIYEQDISAFQAQFPYSYTSCQQQAIDDILFDMGKWVIMDRLLVWDVGFWKTEVAFNAIFNALNNKKQVAFISPLVVLAYEHYEKAIERFIDFWVNIEVLTRLESQRDVTRIIKWLKEWKIDLIIGTHRLLSESIEFKNLWLIVIDEEHKFWVQDKEKIKSIKKNIDVLAMSATPIPRSLNLALSGIRDISILKTPPVGRKNIETLISPFQEKLIQEAGNREFERGGQLFFIHNRVVNIDMIGKQLWNIFPTKKVIITHWQLPGEQLENRILDFKHKKYDILVSTTVIENGIDFSNVNTIFINECQNFGISQLHQLRGRVGRSDKKWYCYLLYKKENISNESAQRLQSIVNYSYLWAGFELAMKDLEIRWWWDILGIRQSGQAKEIGVSLFLKMLEEKIEELKNKKENKTPNISTGIDLQISAGIDDSYFVSETDKIQFYREIESITDTKDLQDLIDGFIETNPEIDEAAENLFNILRLKIYAGKYKISTIKRLGVNYQIDFHESLNLEELKKFLEKDKEVIFHVVDIKRIRAARKLFENDKKFLQYVLDMFESKVWNPKIKLKKKK